MLKYAIKKDKIDLRDKMYRASTIIHPDHLPESVDLRPQMSPIVDQGALGSCTANAVVSGLREYLLLQAGEPLTRLSRLYLYWHERELEGTINEDSGAYIRDGMKVLANLGVPAEIDFPYDIRYFTDRPTELAEVDAAKYKITEYRRITNALGLKTALAEGNPVVIGMELYDSFESDLVRSTGMVPVPEKWEQSLGGHAVCAVGYKKINRKDHIIIRNSWGDGWGDNGYCYVPMSFISRKIIMDMWTGK
jgi:C1A family cysteine protease